MDRKKVCSNFMLVLTALVQGPVFMAQSVGVDYMKPFTSGIARFFTGGVVLTPLIFVMKKQGERVPVETDDPVSAQNNRKMVQRREMGIVGGICYGTALFAASAFRQFGVIRTSVGKAGFIMTLYIIITSVLGTFVKGKVAVTVWVNVVIAMVGMYLLYMSGGSMTVSREDLLVFICSVCPSPHTLVTDYFLSRADRMFLSCVQFFTIGVMAAVPALILEHPTMVSLIAVWAPVLYTGIMSCNVAYALQMVAQKGADPVVASLIPSLESVLSLLVRWMLLGQKLSPKRLFRRVLVFAAILLAQLPEEVFDRKKVDEANLQ